MRRNSPPREDRGHDEGETCRKSYYRREFDFREEGQRRVEKKKKEERKRRKENGAGGSYYLKEDPGEPLLLSSLSFSVCFFRFFSTLSLFSLPPTTPVSLVLTYIHTRARAHTQTHPRVHLLFQTRVFIRGLLSPVTPVNERGMAILSMNERSRLENVYILCMLKYTEKKFS